MTRLTGPACLTDSTGAHLCGPASLHKRGNGVIRRGVRDTWEQGLRLADLMRGECEYDAAGDLVACRCEVFAVTGEWLPRGHGETVRFGVHADGTPWTFVDFGHVIADDLGGVYCGGNALPVRSDDNNSDHNARPTVSSLFPMAYFRAGFREAAMGRMPRTKVARVAN